VIGAQALPFLFQRPMLARTSGSGNRIEETVSAETIAARAAAGRFRQVAPRNFAERRSVLRERHLVPTCGSE
jgi:hypothetical protein